jgi:hypothetical protein
MSLWLSGPFRPRQLTASNPNGEQFRHPALGGPVSEIGPFRTGRARPSSAAASTYLKDPNARMAPIFDNERGTEFCGFAPRTLDGPATRCTRTSRMKGMTVRDDAEDHARVARGGETNREGLGGSSRRAGEAVAGRARTEALTGAMRDEALRQRGLICGGMIGIAVLVVQPFLTGSSRDASKPSASSRSLWPSAPCSPR